MFLNHAESYLKILKQNKDLLLTDQCDRRLVAAIMQYETDEGKSEDNTLKMLKYYRGVILRCRRLGIDQAFRKASVLDTLIEFSIGDLEHTKLINNAPENVKQELDAIFSLRELQSVSLRLPIVKSFLAELNMDNLRNMIIVSALFQFGDLEDVGQVTKIISENPELLSDDVQILIDTLDGADDIQVIEHFQKIKKILIRCIEIGLDGWIQEQVDNQAIRSLKLPEGPSNQRLGNDNVGDIYQKVLRYSEDNPNWINELEDSNSFVAAVFSFIRLFDGTDDPIRWERQVVMTIDRSPIMLTKRFDDAILEMFIKSDPMPLSDGNSDDYGQRFKDSMLLLLNMLRGFRGQGFCRQHIKRYAELVSNKEYPDNLLGQIDASDPIDHSILTGIGLLQSPLPLLVCNATDGRIGLADAIAMITSPEILDQLDDYQIEKQNDHIVYLILANHQDTKTIYYQAELNYAVSITKDNQRLKAKTAGTLRECTIVLGIKETSPEKQFELQARRLLAAHAAVTYWTALKESEEIVNALMALGSACLANPYGDQIINHKEAVENFTHALEVGQKFLSPRNRAMLLCNLAIAYNGLAACRSEVLGKRDEVVN